MLQLRNLHKRFHRGTQSEIVALRDVSLDIETGEFVVVIGQNGSGKSTLLNVTAGLFAPDDGSILLDGTDITAWPEHRRARRISRVFQDPFMGTAASLSISENFSVAAKRGHARTLRRAGTLELLAAISDRSRSMGLEVGHRLDTPIGTLSGGQRQSLTLLMATWETPRLLLLDEHTSALDPKSAELVLRVTKDIVQRNRITTLMVTHSLQEAVHLGSRLIMMHRGTVVRDVRGAEKSRLRAQDLVSWFEELRQIDQLDESTAEFLRSAYV